MLPTRATPINRNFLGSNLARLRSGSSIVSWATDLLPPRTLLASTYDFNPGTSLRTARQGNASRSTRVHSQVAIPRCVSWATCPPAYSCHSSLIAFYARASVGMLRAYAKACRVCVYARAGTCRTFRHSSSVRGHSRFRIAFLWLRRGAASSG